MRTKVPVLGLLLVVAGCGQPASVASPDVATSTAITSSIAPEVSVPEVSVPEIAPEAGTVVLILSVEAGATDGVVARLRELGGTVEAVDATIGYVRVSVPTAVAKAVGKIDGVRRVDVEMPLSNEDPEP
ncbi:hypothetical protein GCM10022243_09040 [Saccharothrix violaceirubra]|uniref:Putative peptidase inhibitor domain-containing protein n=1 Tax=Saccharothrix violaceirubra TaxID=413306 RepID=A0A7W7T119_9PSEU|nr:hypothetical protein [Saccharothrix violaceirubra]MBB4963315.1 hypothetical protein [Saccharothrix violaceirubra]